MDGRDFIRRMEAGGDEARAAFSELYRSYRPRVAGFLRAKYRLAGRDDFVEDIVQTAFLKVGVSWRSYRAEAKLESWLLTIVLNTAKDEFRRQGRRAAATEGEGEASDEGGAPVEAESVPWLVSQGDWDMERVEDGAHEDFCHAECVRRTLDELERSYPKAFALIEWIVLNSPTTEELAEHLQAAGGAARQRKSEYLGILRTLCRKHCGTDECGWRTAR